jgi:hypothetical protein
MKIKLQPAKIFILIFFLLNLNLWAQEYDGTFKTTSIIKTTNVLVIDGLIDDPAWLEANVIKDLHQVFPNEYDDPTELTEVRMLYTDTSIYISARLYDKDASRIIAQVLRQGERAQYDDHFAILLSPFNDGRSGYIFEVNPNGVRSEALFSGRSFNYEWTSIWNTKATRDSDGWTIEMEIPISSLSFDPNSSAWGVNFIRRIGRKRETNGWVSKDRTSLPASSGEVVGFEGLQQGVGLDVIPGLTLTESREYIPSTTVNTTFEPTLDVFYKITPELTGVFTMNTDFSSTEADARQVNLTRFNLFFPEKRDFFLQDSDLFEFGRVGIGTSAASNNGRPFFSRRVGLDENGQPLKIDAGLKLSGRAGPVSIGLLGVEQGASQTLDATKLMVARGSVNIFKDSDIGFILTDGDPTSNGNNRLMGLDFRYQNPNRPSGKLLESEVWYQKTETTGLVDEDEAYGFGVRQNSLNGLGYFLTYRNIGENFNPALGFVNKVGVNWVNSAVSYYHRPRQSYLRHIATRVSINRSNRKLDGSIQSQAIDLRIADMQNHQGDYLRIGYRSNTEGLNSDFKISEGVVIAAGEYTFATPMIELGTGAHRKVYGTLTASSGDFYTGTYTNITPSLTWRPTSHVLLNTSLSINEVTLPEGEFTKELLNLRSEIAFSNTLSWITFAQWDNGSNMIGINSRLHWIPTAGREIYLVVNNALFEEDEDNNFTSEAASLTLRVNYNYRF